MFSILSSLEKAPPRRKRIGSLIGGEEGPGAELPGWFGSDREQGVVAI